MDEHQFTVKVSFHKKMTARAAAAFFKEAVDKGMFCSVETEEDLPNMPKIIMRVDKITNNKIFREQK